MSVVMVHNLGLQSYLPTFNKMQDYTINRHADSEDQIWLLQHQPVFTQGQAGKAEHILAAGDIEVVQVDRGGQVTYHGPGQLIAYVMLDIKRLDIGVRQLVSALEDSLIQCLLQLGIEAFAKPDAPGVYVADAKIASLGLRIKKGRSYHGLALNEDMDLTPFNRINPCGYQGMAITQIADFVAQPNIEQIAAMWLQAFSDILAFSYQQVETK